MDAMPTFLSVRCEVGLAVIDKSSRLVVVETGTEVRSGWTGIVPGVYVVTCECGEEDFPDDSGVNEHFGRSPHDDGDIPYGPSPFR